ncbi:MAG TPA: hypothetical protein DEP48_06020 [Persephonella sp.]|uniref:Uncharacterized protein n=1 Tax=Persephonella marina (strain DSM 14350 / EX-H1) TaxID=123214 RepID=C0QP90_PERMH|nr:MULTISPECIES: hypothetical protein [Persephonella]ACO03783.1 conserved hypothetical protein [Persephonella marina EX-H1]HCB69899.1 hypothetical protein [Persephonella sp.]
MNRDFFSTFEIYPIVIDFYQIILIISGLVLLLISFYLIIRFLKLPSFELVPRKREEKISINLEDPKGTAYSVTFLIHRYDTPYNEQLLKRLERFKYRKKVDRLDRETVELIEKFIEYIKEYGHRV